MLNQYKAKLLASSTRSANRFQTKIKGFGQDRAGVAAIEFALLAPIMITMYFGLAEVAYAIANDRKVSHAANVAGDLATQVSEIDNLGLDEILTATLKTMNVDDVSNVKIEIASYRLDVNENPELVGKATLNPNGSQAFQPFAPGDLDERILSSNSGVVVARIAYSFQPIKFRYFNSTVNLRENFLLKPRRSSEVLIGDAIGTEITCTATSQNDVSCGGAA